MVEVAAAIIKKGETFLVCKRDANDSCPLLWEFPGGKKEQGETIEQCIIREIKEELELDVSIQNIYAETLYHINNITVPFTFFNCEIVAGEMKLNVHDDAMWATKQQLKQLEFMPADIEVVERLSQ